jgi:acyl dehydratase
MADLYFEDFTLGRRFATPGITLTEEEIIGFAMRYDPQPFHIDVEAAKESPFGGLIASGFQTLALSFRMFAQTGTLAAASLGAYGIDELCWLKPVRPGDTIRAEIEVIESRPSSSKPDRGLARMKYAVLNQRDEVVMTFISNQILACRPAA